MSDLKNESYLIESIDDNKDFIEIDGNICCNGEIKLYIPLSYKSMIGFEDQGIVYRLMGIIPYSKNNTLKLLKIPTLININITDIYTDTINLGSEDENCEVMIFGDKSPICKSMVIKDSLNCEIFINYILMGKLPSNLIPYDEIIKIWQMNLKMNGVNFQLPSFILESVIAIACRYKKDNTSKFGQVYGKSNSLTPYDYVMLSVRNLAPKLNTYAALSFEVFGQMINQGIIRTKENIPETESPLEQILYY